MAQKQAVIFELDRVLYGLDIMEVQEIIRMVEITPLAGLDFSTEGIINLRGQVIPVVNLCQKLGLNARVYDESSRVVVVESNGVKTGLIVDRVLEVGNYDSEETVPAAQAGIDAIYLKEIVKKGKILWLVLNLSALH